MKHLKFEVVKEKPKTKVYGVFSVHSGTALGRIYWYFPWRQYIFEPLEFTIWNNDCLKEIYEFLKKLKEGRRKK